MQQTTNTQRTTKEMSSEELASCRKQLERRWKSRKVDETLLEQAWQVAYEIATLLYDEFSATQVAIFGSLAEPINFTKSSDIDIAVWGLSDKTHSTAYWKVKGIDTGFKIDLINFDITKGIFQERIQQQAIIVKKGEQPTLWKTLYEHLQRQVFPIVEEEIYEMNRKKLTQRINDEHAKIESTVGGIVKALEDIEVLPVAAREYIEESIANRLADVYSGIERIFERIANEVDAHLSRGSRWHKNLLEQMTEQRSERPPVISQETFQLLAALLEFRHKVNNIYADEIIYENTVEHARDIEKLFQSFSEDIHTFTNSLAQRNDD
ncbi:MAG: nucleotidyltransferase domain-containing protein [Candidatus Poribacteria bacterium]|nr:nucleotidyltransferase domain-containing protein [Candidatus Poribacteria bacterium]